MKVKELIQMLAELPPDAYVWHLWDGEARTQVKHVWLSKNGRVITADDTEVCYSTETRPMEAPDAEEDPYWKTPQTPQTEED